MTRQNGRISHSRGPYYPNQGNGGWIEDDPEEDSEEKIPEEEPEEESEEDPEEDPDEESEEEGDGGSTDSELEVYNPPQGATIPRQNFQGPTPRWAVDLKQWSREQGQRPPYDMKRGFYNLNNGGSADRAFPIMVRRIANKGAQARANASQLLDIRATAPVIGVRLCNSPEFQVL